MGFIRKLATFIAALLIVAIAVVISVGNHVVTDLRFWPFETPLSMPLSMLILGSFGIGLVAGGVAMLPPLMRCAWQQRRLRATIGKMEKTADRAAATLRGNGDGGDDGAAADEANRRLPGK